MIEIILGAIVTVLTFVAHWIFPENMYEKKVRESMIILASFGLTMIVVAGYYLLSYKQVITPQFIQVCYAVLTIGVGSYEVLYKQIIRKVLINMGILTEDGK